MFVVALLVTGGVLLYARSQPAPAPPQEVNRGVQIPTQVAGVPDATASTPTIGAVSATPTLITVNTPTSVTFTANISDPALIPNSVNLLQLGTAGRQPAILGQLQASGNNTYTITYTFNQSAAGSLQIQVSAAFRGTLKRVLSNVMTLSVWNVYSNPPTNITLAYPQFGSGTQVVTSPPPAGQTLYFDIEGWSTSQQQLVPVVGVSVYPNSTGTTLWQWFENNVDVNGILQASGTYQYQQLSNGITALTLAAPLPIQYFNAGGGPTEEVYALSPLGDYVITLTQSQVAQLSDYGYEPLTLLVQILNTMAIP